MAEIETASLTGVHWAAIVAAAVTGVVHLFLGVSFAGGPLGWSFLLAGLGFFGAIGLVLVDYRRRLVYAAGIPYVALQIVLWYVLNFDGIADLLANVGWIGAADKVVQVLLLALLVVLLRRQAEPT